MADTQILASGSAAVPESYTVPAGQEIVLKTVSAEIDGSGASGNFVPTLEIDNGSAAGPWIYPLNQTVTAGGSVDVTWGPFPVVEASTGGALNPDWGTYFIGGGNVPAGALRSFTWSANAGDPVLDLHGALSPTFAATGVYTVSAWIQSSDTWTVGAVAGARLTFGDPTDFEQRQTGTANIDGVLHNFGIQLTAEVDAGQAVEIGFENFDTSTRAMYTNQILVQLIGTF